MSRELIWKVITCLAAVAATVCPLIVSSYISYDMHDSGEHPEKHLELVENSSMQFFRDMSALAAGGKVTLQAGERDFKNLFIVRATLHNAGKSPILPSDFHENLSVEIKVPWEIVAIENVSDSVVGIKWNKVNEQKFTSAPLLLNPNDEASFVIYMTNDSLGEMASLSDDDKPSIKWHARIVNLRAIDQLNDSIEKEIQAPASGPKIYVHLGGWKLCFFVIASILNLTALLVLLHKCSFLRLTNYSYIFWVTGAVLLSAIASECASTYVFGHSIYALGDGSMFITRRFSNSNALDFLFRVDHQLNAPPLILNSTVLIFLLLRPKLKRRSKAKIAKKPNDIG